MYKLGAVNAAQFGHYRGQQQLPIPGDGNYIEEEEEKKEEEDRGGGRGRRNNIKEEKFFKITYYTIPIQ